jgi:chorismate dehydratase
MNKTRISIVSYLNAKPFLFGLKETKLINEIDLSEDIPSLCAQKLIAKEVEIGLVPIAIIPQLSEAHILSNYCIGAKGKVNSVMLYSQVPLSSIQTILLDYQSRTSVNLVKVLAHFFWKIEPKWRQASVNYEKEINGTTAAVVIGDRTFELNNTFLYQYDLAEEWYKFTKLPFVFAIWLANKKLDTTFIERFNASLCWGLQHKEKFIAQLQAANNYAIDVNEYLNSNIQYEFDEEKKKGMNLFLDYLSKLSAAS